MKVDVLETPDLGDRSYLVSAGTTAVVVDPQRDIDRVLALVAERGVTVTHVLETHIHNDYVTGGLALARRLGAEYVVNADDPVAYQRTAVSDGDELVSGDLRVRVVATPGHTFTHLTYVISGAGDEQGAAFTGGSLLYGSVGRTDLLGDEHTDALTRHQWRSARRLAGELPDPTPVYPTHGFGSFCSSGGATGASAGTIGSERVHNDALTTDDEDAYVTALVAGLTGYPRYYAHMGPANLAGPGEPDLSPPTAVDPAELARRIVAGEWVVDLRDKAAYAGRHLVGTVNIGIGPQFSTYAGWIVPWGAPITLLGDDADQVAQATRQLVRIGIDELAGAATGELDTLAAGVATDSYPRATFVDLAAEPDAVVLDVRRDDERRSARIAGSAHMPLDQLLDRLDELPEAGPLWVHCAGGFRASIAASLLARAGRDVVHVDDSFDEAEKAGLTVER